VDLKLRSGASLHLRWSQYASNNAKNEPCLTDELLKISKELPKPSPPNDADFNRNEDEHDDAPKDKSKDGKSSDSKTNVEKRLKGLLRLSKK
jgi:tether containing UBX domain for GLUT4